jgi:hypothetical protein
VGVNVFVAGSLSRGNEFSIFSTSVCTPFLAFPGGAEGVAIGLFTVLKGDPCASSRLVYTSAIILPHQKNMRIVKQMKLSGNVELAVVVALVGLIAFMPRLLSPFVSSPIGKAVAFGLVAYLWKQHNELVALLLTAALLKAAPAYEGVDSTLKKPEEKKMASMPEPEKEKYM